MLSQIIYRAVMQGIPLLFGSTGEILTEKSGNLNLGIPGIMYVGGISGVIGAFFYETRAASFNPVIGYIIPVLCTIIGSLLMGLIYCFLTVTLRANQNVTGLALTTFGVGVGNFFGGSLIKLVDTDVPSIALSKTSLALKTGLPFDVGPKWLDQALFSYSYLAYSAVIIAIAAAWFLKRSKGGLYLRAVGENPATADAAGISVSKYKYIATCVGSVIAGFGGLYYVMEYANGVWSNDAFGDRGWLAIALVIFAIWRPNLAIIGSVVFGGLYIGFNYIPGLTFGAQELFKMAPYIVTILVLIFISIRDKKENQPPASLGVSYFREDR